MWAIFIELYMEVLSSFVVHENRFRDQVYDSSMNGSNFTGIFSLIYSLYINGKMSVKFEPLMLES